jgi:hypothetical protein
MVGEGRSARAFSPHPDEEGTEIRKPQGLAVSSPMASSPVISPFPATSWPPSLVPTWKTTAWAGACFSRLTRSGLVTTHRREPALRTVRIVPVLRSRELASLGARARAPPPNVQRAPEYGRREHSLLFVMHPGTSGESQTITRRRGDTRKT